MEKVRFGHICFGGAVMSGMVTVASMLGHVESNVILPVIGTIIGMLALSVQFAKFK